MSDARRSRPSRRAWFLLALALVLGCDGPPPLIAPEASLKGHSGEVVALAFAPDGKSLASRSPDAVKVWDVASRRSGGRSRRTGRTSPPLAFSPDGRSHRENRAGVGAVAWDLASGAERASTGSPTSRPGRRAGAVGSGWGLDYSPDGLTLAAGVGRPGGGGFVALWDVESGEMPEIGGGPSPVTTVVSARRLVPRGRHHGGRCPRLRPEPASGFDRFSDRAALPGPGGLFPRTGRRSASASDDRRVKLWDRETGRERGVLKAHMKAISCVAYHPGGRVLASSDSGGNLFLWDLARVVRSPDSKGIAGRSGRWRSRPTGRRWPRPARTAKSGSGTSRERSRNSFDEAGSAAKSLGPTPPARKRATSRMSPLLISPASGKETAMARQYDAFEDRLERLELVGEHRAQFDSKVRCLKTDGVAAITPRKPDSEEQGRPPDRPDGRPGPADGHPRPQEPGDGRGVPPEISARPSPPVHGGRSPGRPVRGRLHAHGRPLTPGLGPGPIPSSIVLPGGGRPRGGRRPGWPSWAIGRRAGG